MNPVNLRHQLLLFTAVTAITTAHAAMPTFVLETRMAAQSEWLDGTKNHDASGFKGQWLNFRMDGELVEGLTYSYRQRLNKLTDRTFFDATDWIHLDWQIDEHWSLSGGKQVVLIGGYEYDRAPIDLYYCSEFWGNIACYQLGISGGYRFSKYDQLTLQVCNSPFREWSGNDTYAYNLYWSGQHGSWETLWSLNLVEYKRGSVMAMVALGNNFTLDKHWNLNLDVMNRGNRFFEDFSVMTELNWRPNEAWRCFGKYTFDQNHSGTDIDHTVLDGTKLQLVSGGVEWVPKSSKLHNALRLFACAGYSWGTNTNPAPYLQDNRLQVQVGFKLKIAK